MEDEKRKRRFEKFRVDFMDEVKPTELLPHLGDCLTKQLEEQVERWEDREGARRAAYRFSLDLVKKDRWYPNLLIALRKTGHGGLADKIEGVERQDDSGASQRGGDGGGGGNGGGNGGGGRGGGDGESGGGRPGGNRLSYSGAMPKVHIRDAYNPNNTREYNKEPKFNPHQTGVHQRPPVSLDTPIGELSCGVDIILERLNDEDVRRHYDWRGLAVQIDADFTSVEMGRIERTKNPTKELLNSWKQGNTLRNLLMHLYNIERHDIICDLEETLDIKWPRPEQKEESQSANHSAIMTEGRDSAVKAAVPNQDVCGASSAISTSNSNNPDQERSKTEKKYSDPEEDIDSKQANEADNIKLEAQVCFRNNPDIASISDDQSAPLGINNFQNTTSTHEDRRSNEVNSEDTKAQRVKSEARDMLPCDSSPINDINHDTERVSGSMDQLDLNIVPEVESVIDNNDNGFESSYPSTDTIKSVKSAAIQQSYSETSAHSSHNQKIKSNATDSSYTSSETIKGNMSSNVQSSLDTNNGQSTPNTSADIENPIEKVSTRMIGHAENDDDVAISVRSPEQNEHLYDGLNDSSIKPLESNAEIDETVTQENRSPEQRVPYKSVMSSAGNDPLQPANMVKMNDTTEILNQNFEKNQEAARQNFAKSAENGNQFDFDQGSPRPFKANNNVKLLDVTVHEDIHDSSSRAPRGTDETSVKQEEKNLKPQSDPADERENNALREENPVSQRAPPLDEPITLDLNSQSDAKSADKGLEEEPNSAKSLIPSIVHLFASVSSMTGNTKWHTE